MYADVSTVESNDWQRICAVSDTGSSRSFVRQRAVAQMDALMSSGRTEPIVST